MNFIVYFQFLPHFLEICSADNLQQVQFDFTNRTDLIKGDTLYSEESFFSIFNEINQTYPDLVKNNVVKTGAVYQNFLDSRNKSSCIYFYGARNNISLSAKSIRMEYNWVGSLDYIPSICFSIYFIGLFIGSFIGGFLSDKYGRKFVFFWATVGQFLSCIFSGWLTLDTWPASTYAMWMLLNGCFGLINLMVPFVLTAEIVSKDHRAMNGFISAAGFPIGAMMLAPCVYYLADWRSLAIVSGLTFLPFLYPFWFNVLESPRFLLKTGKIKAALRIIHKIAKENGRKFDFTEANAAMVEIEYEKPRYSKFFTKTIFKNFTILTICWVAINIPYYCLQISIIDLPGNVYMNIFTLGFIMFVSQPIGYMITNLFSRRLCASFMFSLVSLVILLLIFNSKNKVASIEGLAWRQQFLHQVLQLPLNAVYSVIYLMLAEIFPTEIRSSAMSTAATIARLAPIPALMLSEMLRTDATQVYQILFCVSVIPIIAVWLLPETKKVELDK